jgi:hypothetical protein
MRVYHGTTTEAADAIERDGFRDGEGDYGFIFTTKRGVFVGLEPPNDYYSEAPPYDVTFTIDVPDDELAPYWINDTPSGVPVWEACVPAEVLNRYERTVVVKDEDTGAWVPVENR